MDCASQSFASRVTRYLSYTLGRDRLLRLIQHFSRLCSWGIIYTRTKHNTTISKGLATLRNQIVLTRKLLRAGSTIEQIRSATSANSTKTADPIIRLATAGRFLALASYSSLDAMTLLDSLEVHKWKQAKMIRREATRSWWTAIILSIVIQAYTLRALESEPSTPYRDEVEKEWPASR